MENVNEAIKLIAQAQEEIKKGFYDDHASNALMLLAQAIDKLASK